MAHQRQFLKVFNRVVPQKSARDGCKDDEIASGQKI